MQSLRRSVSFAVLPVLATAASAQHMIAPLGGNPPRAAEIMVFDPVRGRSVAFEDQQTWEHDGFSWRQSPTTTNPTHRFEFAMAWDGQRVVLYGGDSLVVAGVVHADFWAYDGVAWTLIGNNQAPGLRRAAAMAYDPMRGRVVLYGGTDMNNGFPADTWEWDGAAWAQVGGPGPTPGSRVWHRMVYDDSRQRIVLCGGAFNPVIYTDTWEWDGTVWTETVVNAFPPTIHPALVHDQSTGRTLMIGGLGATFRNEVHAYDAATGTWSMVLSTPTIEQYVGATYDPDRQRVVVLTGDPAAAGSTTYYYRDTGIAGASYSSFGSGCPLGTNQVPQLDAANGSMPQIGSNYTVTVAPTGAAIAVALAVGLSRSQWNGLPLPTPLAPYGLAGCGLYVAPLVLLTMPLGRSSASLTRTMPNSLALRGMVFHEQALLFDPTAANGAGAVSNAALAVVH